MDMDHMLYRCPCGRLYRICPKEIPLAKDEIIFCDCGRLIQDKHGTRCFDFERLSKE